MLLLPSREGTRLWQHTSPGLTMSLLCLRHGLAVSQDALQPFICAHKPALYGYCCSVLVSQ